MMKLGYLRRDNILKMTFTLLRFNYPRLSITQLKYMAITGVRPLLTNEKSPFNRRNSQTLLFFGLCMTAAIASLLIDAQQLQEYAEYLF